jgi:hypothetical protein
MKQMKFLIVSDAREIIRRGFSVQQTRALIDAQVAFAAPAGAVMPL